MDSFSVIPTSDQTRRLSVAEEFTPILSRDENKAIDSQQNITLRSGFDELLRILRLAWPIILAELIQSLPLVYNLRMAGMLGTKELASATLGSMIFLSIGMPMIMGILAGLETLASQAFTGSENKHQVGIFAQRAFILCSISALPAIVVCLNSHRLLLSVGQDPELAKMASSFLHYFTLVIPVFIINEIIKKFLQVQGITQPPFYISLFTAPLHIFVVRRLVLPQYANLGLIGIPVATTMTTCITIGLLLGYAVTCSARECWGGISRKALCGWGGFMRVAFPGIAMMAGVIWPIELISFVASYFGSQSLSSQSITNTSFQLMFLVHSGISTGASVSIGNHLGASLPNRSRLSANSALAFGTLLGIVEAILLFIYRSSVVEFFTNDKVVQELAIKTVGLVAVCQPFVALGSISTGVLRGQGRQRISAFFKLTAGYFLAIPLGILLARKFDLKLLGLWIGVGTSWIYAAIGELLAVLRSDWPNQVLLCKQRIHHSIYGIEAPLTSSVDHLNA